MIFEVSVGSIPGPYHVKNGIPNQDAFFYQQSGEWIVSVVADGAGSLKYSDTGAQAAVQAAGEVLLNSLDSIELSKLSAIGINAAREVQLAFKDYKEYGSTLTLVVMSSTGEWAAGSVGDSFGVIHLDSGAHELITGTSIGEYANITELLTSSVIHPVYVSGAGAFGSSLSSDGLERVALSNNQPHKAFWDGITTLALQSDLDVNKLFEWLGSLDKIVDDTTLLTSVKR